MATSSADLADRLFHANLAGASASASRPSGHHFRVSQKFTPEAAAQQAIVHGLSTGDEVWCSSEQWRLATCADSLRVFVPETHIEEVEPMGQRYKVTLELIETEEVYNDSLGIICETVIKPLERGNILPAPTIKKIFASSERLYSASKELAIALRLRLRDGWDESSTCVGDVLGAAINKSDSMLGQSRFVDAYVQFINGYEQSQRALHSIETNPEWIYFLKHWSILVHATGRAKAPPNLLSLLVKPVQRVPRFKLLLEQLLKATPLNHPDRSATESALKHFSELASSVNEAIRRREQVEAVHHLQSEFGGGTETLAKEGRYLIKRAEDVIVGWPPMGEFQASESKPRKVVLLLFNDALLLAEHNTFGGKLSLFQWFIPDAAGRALPGEKDGTLHLVRKASNGADETLSFTLSPPAEAEEWLEQLRRTSCQPRGAMAKAGSSFCGCGASGLSERSASSFAGGGSGGGGSKPRPAAAVGQGILAGWLQKKGGGGAEGTARNWAKGGRRNWKSRWVVVTNNQYIVWFDSEKAKEPKGSLALIGAQVSKSDRPGGFWILTNNRSLELMADSEEKAARWVAVLQETANKLPSVKGEVLLEEEEEEEVPVMHASGYPPPPMTGNTTPFPAFAPPPQAPPPQLRVKVLWDYTAQREEDLTIRRGEIVEVTSTDGDWWVGTIGGRFGAFPSNYTQPIAAEPAGAFGGAAQHGTPASGMMRAGSSLVSGFV